MSKPKEHRWSAMARCPGCGRLITKATATRIGKRYYGPECARVVLANLTNFRLIKGHREDTPL